MQGEFYIIDTSKKFQGTVKSLIRNGINTITGETWETMQKQNPSFIAITEEEFFESYFEPYKLSLQEEWQEIDEEKHDYYLEVLPPMRWKNGMFWMEERFYDILTRVVLTHHEKHYTAIRDLKKSNSEIRQEFNEWYHKQKS